MELFHSRNKVGENLLIYYWLLTAGGYAEVVTVHYLIRFCSLCTSLYRLLTPIRIRLHNLTFKWVSNKLTYYIEQNICQYISISK